MTIKRFLKLQIILVLLLAIAVVGNTLSWATRPAVKGGGFMSSSDNDFAAIELDTPAYFVNGNSCTAVTYTGTLNEETGEITYSDTPLVLDDENAFTETMQKGAIFYFKTVISNTSEVSTNVSLFINGISHNNLGTSVMLGVTSPITAQKAVTTTSRDTTTHLKYFDFMPVVSQYEVPAASETEAASVNVEWTVYYMSQDDESEEFKITDVILTNN